MTTVTINGTDYEAITDEHGVLRFPTNQCCRNFVDRSNTYDMNRLWIDYCEGNIPIQDLMDFYRYIGYSVFGFWEVFGWEMNTDGHDFEPVEMLVGGQPYPEDAA